MNKLSPKAFTTIFTIKHFLESCPKLGTEHIVDDRVEKRVYVSKPKHEALQKCGYYPTVYEWSHDGNDEEPQPANNVTVMIPNVRAAFCSRIRSMLYYCF